MTTPTPDVNKFGPGTLTIGATGAELDVSCQVNSFKIAATADRGDTKTMLCGTQKVGAVQFSYEASANFDLDLDQGASGLFALSQLQPGSTQEFKFIPNTGGGVYASGTIIVDPLEFGGEEYGEIMNSDATWSIEGAPEYGDASGPWTGAAVAITGVVAGSPGSFQPSGATKPANLTALKADTVVGDTGSNKPSATPWTTGQSVKLADNSDANWTGTAWAAGTHAAAAAEA